MINVVREPGRGFQARCPSCGTVTPHRPAGTGQPEQARCGRCGGLHRARPLPETGAESPGAASRPPPPLPHRRRVPDAVEQQWHDEIAAQGPDGATPYRADRGLAVGELVDHPIFGLGRVRKLVPPATAEIHFQGGFKRLRCRM